MLMQMSITDLQENNDNSVIIYLYLELSVPLEAHKLTQCSGHFMTVNVAMSALEEKYNLDEYN